MSARTGPRGVRRRKDDRCPVGSAHVSVSMLACRAVAREAGFDVLMGWGWPYV